MVRGLDEPEKDPSLFPESRVRPWVLDDAAELKVQDMRDEFEKTLTFVSPVKEGLEKSLLDRMVPEDKRCHMFLEELARLKVDRAAADRRKASGKWVIQPIGEVFEDLSRETHGLSPKAKQKSVIDCSTEGLRSEESIRATDEGNSELEQERQDVETMEIGGHGGLAEDSDVARLVDLLHKVDSEFCTSSEAGSEIGSSQNSHDSGTESRVEEETDERGQCADGRNGGGVGRCELGDLEHDAADEGLVSGDAANSQSNGRERNAGGSRSTEGRQAIKNQQEEPSRIQQTDAQHLTQQQQQQQQPHGRIDISRMKIDGTERGKVVGPRPRSAPSTCLSAGGFSQLSRTSSSHLARTVSQKLLQAEREVAQLKSLDAKEVVPAPPLLAIAEPGVGIDTVKQNADALQASKAVKRTSYLKGYRPRTTKWPARDTDAQDVSDAGRKGVSSMLYSLSVENEGSAVTRKQRSITAGNRRRNRTRLVVVGGSRSTTLLTRTERDFVFGKTASAVVPATSAATGADGIQPTSYRPPSARYTTPGKMLGHVAPAADATTSRRRYQTRKPGYDCSANSRVGGRRACSSSLGGSVMPKHVNSRRGGKMVRTRPTSAVPSDQGRSSVAFTTSPSREAKSSRSTEKRASQPLGSREESFRSSGCPWIENVVQSGTTLVDPSPAPDVLVEERSGIITGGGNTKNLKLLRLRRDGRREMNVHLPLNL